MYEPHSICEIKVKKKEPQYFTLSLVITCRFYSLYMILYFLEILIVTYMIWISFNWLVGQIKKFKFKIHHM